MKKGGDGARTRPSCRSPFRGWRLLRSASHQSPAVRCCNLCISRRARRPSGRST